MKIKVLVNTPKNQAQKAIESQKKMLIGYSRVHNVVAQKLINDHQFYWIIEMRDIDEYLKVAKRCANSEVFIKKFYYSLIRLLDRANKLAAKFKKGTDWMKRWLLWNLKKTYKSDNSEDSLISEVENMSDAEFLDFIKISDRKAMEELLKGPLIVIEAWPAGDY